MTQEKQRIAIATACGWTADSWCLTPSGWVFADAVPDYHNDLNACHEMEKVLTHDQRIDYMEWLGLCSDDHWYKVWDYVHSTSAERCTAFLRTMGLWEKEANTTKSASSTSPVAEESSATPTFGNEADFVTKSTQLNHND